MKPRDAEGETEALLALLDGRLAEEVVAGAEAGVGLAQFRGQVLQYRVEAPIGGRRHGPRAVFRQQRRALALQPVRREFVRERRVVLEREMFRRGLEEEVASRVASSVGGEVLDVKRHGNKLKTGHLAGNRLDELARTAEAPAPRPAPPAVRPQASRS